jgi:photosystem II stability/assembly factor-like uncharacterized protein
MKPTIGLSRIKVFRSVILLLLLISSLSSLSQWTWLNPLPQGNTLRALQFIKPATCIAVGDGGTVLKSTNMGNTWSRLYTGTMLDFTSLFFINPDTGFIVGNSDEWSAGKILKTTDGGLAWTETYPPYPEMLYSICFTDASTGYVGGLSYFFKTGDGGNSWEYVNSINNEVDCIFFTDHETGYIPQGDLMKTTDAGNTWVNQVQGLGFFTIFFTTKDKGYAPSYWDKNIYKSTDAGSNWSMVPSTTNRTITSLYFPDTLHGFGVGDSGVIIKTTDEGNNWSTISPGSGPNLLSLSFLNADSGMTVGQYGTIIQTLDQGNTWNPKSSSLTFDNLGSISFPSSNTGYVTGENGTILKTTNAGSSWNHLNTTTQSNLYSVFFTDVNNGFVGEENGRLLKTTDGGNTWVEKFVGGGV